MIYVFNGDFRRKLLLIIHYLKNKHTTSDYKIVLLLYHWNSKKEPNM